MGQSIRGGCIGLITGFLLTSCQQNPAIEPALAPNVPTRSVNHVMGTSQVPVSPERIVVLDTTPLDAALALGVDPVGTISYGMPPGYLGKQASDIEVIGQFNQPNLEAILKLKPDLILGAKSISERLYPRLSRIAPTVFIEGAGRSWDWKNNFRIYADALNHTEQAEQLITDYEQQVTDLQASLVPSPESLTVSVVLNGPFGFIAHTPKSFSGSVLQEVGFQRNTVQSNNEQFFIRLSREDLESPEGDVLFLIHYPNTTSKEEFVNNRLWSQLDVVQRDAVCEVKGEVWAAGRSILAAHQILKDVQRCLAQLQ
ncbi:periplasmic binding protein [Leptolyngbya sp. Heron Island J]|uniref:ABC transporter substrate-binding protein n=1 Tax=Leptolyngbya sp. Heron Island J TaxID=1385935 RepID=UPI0003B99E72|nr:iron-siderophore ABC transporter substrate-binding protein [Leptolyngbya sp. Heron Island J]ESA33900.1 periplasmic binding protein [Leptolyngbya sp. Heron Island J]